MARVSPEGGEESDSSKIAREKEAAENGREEEKRGGENAEGCERVALDEIEALKKNV